MLKHKFALSCTGGSIGSMARRWRATASQRPARIRIRR